MQKDGQTDGGGDGNDAVVISTGIVPGMDLSDYIRLGYCYQQSAVDPAGGGTTMDFRGTAPPMTTMMVRRREKREDALQKSSFCF